MIKSDMKTIIMYKEFSSNVINDTTRDRNGSVKEAQRVADS